MNFWMMFRQPSSIRQIFQILLNEKTIGEELSETWHLFVLILKTIIWLVIMVINDSVNIYLAFRSDTVWTILRTTIFGKWIYLFSIFIFIALRGMKAFPLNFMVAGGFLLTDSFHRFSGEKPGELHKILVCGGSPQGKIGWKSLCFALCLCIYLFIICFFIACLYVCFLITLRELFVASCINYVV